MPRVRAVHDLIDNLFFVVRASPMGLQVLRGTQWTHDLASPGKAMPLTRARNLAQANVGVVIAARELAVAVLILKRTELALNERYLAEGRDPDGAVLLASERANIQNVVREARSLVAGIEKDLAAK